MQNNNKKIHSIFLFSFLTTLIYFLFVGSECNTIEPPPHTYRFSLDLSLDSIGLGQEDSKEIIIFTYPLPPESEYRGDPIRLSMEYDTATFPSSFITYTFDPNPIDFSLFQTTSKLNLKTVLNSPIGNYEVTIWASNSTSNYQTPESTTLLLTVISATNPDFSLSLSRPTISLDQGNSDTLTVFVNRSGVHNDPVTLSLESLPSDVTGTFNPPVVPANDNSSTLTLTADPGAAINSGTPVLVKGADGSLENSIYFSLEVTGYVNPWQIQSFGQFNTLYGVHFTDINHGVAVGWSGTFIKTTDGGINWQQSSTNTNEYLNAVQFIDPITGYIVGDNNKFLFTSDGGSNWIDTLGVDSISTDFKGLYFLSAQKGWTIGSHIFYTFNGGENWDVQLDALYGRYWNDVKFGSNTNGVVVGRKSAANGEIFYTNDGGYNWLESNYPSGINEINAVCFVNSTTVFAAGNGGIVLKSIDGGANWSKLTNTSDYLRGVSFADENNGWVVSNSIMHTTDGGQTWVEEMALTRAAFDVYFLNSETGYVAGGSGIILRRK